MKPIVSIGVVATGILLTGMAAFAFAAGTATPSVAAIPSVVTDRPVREAAVSASPAEKAPAIVRMAKEPTGTPAAAPAFTSRLITTARKNIRAGVSSKPVVVPEVIVVAPRPEAESGSVDDDDHEVVAPGVRDDTDDEDNAHGDASHSDSYDRSEGSSKPAFRKGD